MFSWNWAPEYWLPCNGATYQFQQYQALGSVIGTIYGGTYGTNFAVPNIQCCAPIGQGQGVGLTPRILATTPVGVSQVAISYSSMPNHNHTLNFAGSTRGVPGTLVAKPTVTSLPAQELTSIQVYSNASPDSTLAANVLGSAGAMTPASHNNVQPLLAVQFCICYNGLYPVPAS